MAVERFDGEYSKDGVAFDDAWFEEVMEFGRMQKHNGDLGTLDV